MLMVKRYGALLGLFAILLTFAACSAEQTARPAPELLTNAQSLYTTVEVEFGEFSAPVSGTASLIYPVQKDLMWNGKNASIQQILVKRGEVVTKGQTLIRMQISYSSADLAQWKLQLQRAEEDLSGEIEKREAAITEARDRLAGLEGYEKALAELSVKKLELALEEHRLEAQIKIVQLRDKINAQVNTINDDILTAPFDGIVDYVANMSEGDPVNTGTILLRMHSPGTVLFRAEGISEKLFYNMPVTVDVGRGNNQRSFAGVVVSAPNILPSSINSDTAYIQLANDISVEEISGSVSYHCSGMELRNVLVLDAKAVHREDGKTYVNILSDGRVEKRFVVIQSNGSDYVWVLDGLQEGQKIILD